MTEGDLVGTFSHPGETFTVIKEDPKMRAVLLRALDGKEFWLSVVMIKPAPEN